MQTLIDTFQTTVMQLEGNVYWLVLSYLFFSEFGVPIPLPGTLVLIAAGYLLGQAGIIPLLLIVGSVAAVVPGATVLYWVGRRGGEPLLRRWGPRLGLTIERQQRLVRDLARNAVWGLILARILPVVRVGTTLLPGAIGMPWPRYMAGMGTALCVWVITYISAGYMLAVWGTTGLVALPVLLLLLGLGRYIYRRHDALKNIEVDT